MSGRSTQTLHVTNGDSVISTFKKAGILGTHLAWRDVLHEGPVPGGLSLQALSRVRGAYLASRGYGNPIKLLHDFEHRDELINRAREFAEVVLWFEHDLYDQLHLAQLLPLLEGMDLEPGAVSIVQSAEYLGSMTSEELAALHPKRRAVSPAMFAMGQRAWAAVTSADPRVLREETDGEAGGLPFMRPALRRLCEEYPWTSDGLSRSERQALLSAAHSPARKEELFRRSQAREEAAFLGDRSFYAILDDLAREPALLEGEGDAFVPTALGRRVLAGDADRGEAGPLDRWVGGVHLEGDSAARWDDDASTFKMSEQAVDS